MNHCDHYNNICLNPFVPNGHFLYPLKTSENLTVQVLCFQGAENGCIGNKWVNPMSHCPRAFSICKFYWLQYYLNRFFPLQNISHELSPKLHVGKITRNIKNFHRRNVYTRLSFCSSFSMLLTHFWPMFTFYTPWKHLKWWLWAYILGKVRNSKLLLAKRKNRIHLVSDLEDNFHKKCLHIKNFGTSS